MELFILGETLDDCPIWWQNFIDYILDSYDEYAYGNDSVQNEILIKDLAKYNGMPIFIKKHDYTDIVSIVFTEEQYAIYFIMKWG